MRQPLFLHTMKVVEKHDDYFVQKRNVANVLELSFLQKVVARTIFPAEGRCCFSYVSLWHTD
jgi:hypothetical protein